MWRAGVDVKMTTDADDDDAWETDPDFVVGSYSLSSDLKTHPAVSEMSYQLDLILLLI